MNEANVIKAYAHALTELAVDAKVDIAEEITQFSEIINKSNELENLLFLDVFTVEEKELILNEIFSKSNYSSIFSNFIKFLLAEKRLNFFPMIFKEIIVIDDHKKGFIRGTIEGSSETLSEEFKNKITSFLKDKLSIEPHLNYVKSEKISAGYKITVEDFQVDASLENQLSKLKENILD